MSPPSPGAPPGRLSRRRLLALAGVGAAGLCAWRASGYPDAERFRGLACLSPTASAILVAVLEATLPPGARRDVASLEGHVRAVDAYLVGLPREDVRDVHGLLFAIEHLTPWTGLRLSRFTSLDAEGRRAVLDGMAASRIGLLRLGLRSAVTLAFLAHYRTREAFAPLGYAGPTAGPESAPAEARARYDALLAPDGAEPAFS